MEEFITVFAIAVFVLSQISERISNLLKLYLPESIFGNLRNKEVDPKLEKKRERRLIMISWVAGAFTSLVFYGIIDSQNQVQVDAASGKNSNPLGFLKDINCSFLFYLALSLFLSFGSKFWHDVLDIIFLYKNAKRVLNDPETFQVNSTASIMQQLNQNSGEIARMAWEAQKNELKKYPGVVAVAVGHTTNGVTGIRIYIEKEEYASKISKEIIWVDNSGFAHHVPIQVIISGVITTQDNISGYLENAVFNQASPSKKGTLSYFFIDNVTKEQFILSCYHVMRHQQPWNFYRHSGAGDNIIFGVNGQHTAKLIAGYRSSELDIAIAKVDSPIAIDKDNELTMNDTATVDNSWVGASVRIKGAVSKTVDAVVYEPNVESVTIRYGNEGSYDFMNFFSLAKAGNTNNLVSPTKPGDSGALVYDPKTKTAIGIIVGGNDNLSYAMKISVIEKHLGISIGKFNH